MYKNVILLVPSLSDGAESSDKTTAITGGYVEWLCVNKGTKDAPSWAWEQIGTTEADLHGYVSQIQSGNTVDNHTSPVYASISSNGYLTLGIDSATSDKLGVSKMFSGSYWQLPSTATDTAVSTLTASQMFTNIGHKLSDKADADNVVSSINGLKGAVNLCVHNYIGYDHGSEGNSDSNSIDHANLWGMTFANNGGDDLVLVDEFVGLSSSYLNTANLPNNAVSVENNFVYNADGDVITTIRPERMVTGFSAATATNLESFVGDMPNLTNGTAMFKNCAQLTTFVGDLSSLETADEMFYGCTLDAESLEILADTLPTVTSGIIDIGSSINAT